MCVPCPPTMGFEEDIQRQIFSGTGDRTFIDKLLARQDVDALRELIRKPRLTRKELLDAMIMLSGTESKLLNYGEWDRYVILKFYVWIGDFIKLAEFIYDYKEDMMKMEKAKKIVLTDDIKQMLDNSILKMEHNAKFLMALYLNIGRTSLSIGATGLMELLKNKYEVIYPNQAQTQAVESKPVMRVGK